MNTINPTYRPAFQSRARYRIVYGGAGSGKSVAIGQHFVDLASNLTGARVLVLRKVARTCRGSTFKLFTDIIRSTGTPAKVNKQEMAITFASGGEILHAGLDDVEKLKSIAGITHIWIEEATELDFPLSETEEPDLAQVDLRLRGVAPEMRPSITLTFNPTLAAQRLFEYVGVSTADLPVRSHKEYDGGQVFVQHTTWRDNPFVGEDYVAVFQRLGGVMQAVYERGELVAVDAPDQLIKYEWVKAAFERDPEDAAHDGRQRLALDVARFGDDETVLGHLKGWALAHTEAYPMSSTTEAGRRGVSLAREHSISAEMVVVDTVGVGGGTADTFRDEGLDVTEFIAGASPVSLSAPPLGDEWPDFNNLRSQGWWHLRVQMEAGAVAISITDEGAKRKLQEELLAPRYRFGQEKKIEVEPKDGRSKAWGLKARLGRSPDYGDMLMMGVFAEHLDLRLDYSRVF